MTGIDSTPEPADIVVLSRRIITMDPETDPRIEAVAVRGKRILRLLRRDEISAVTDEKTRIIDVGDRPVMPGFVDPHAHIEVACRSSYGVVDCRAPECGTIDQVIAALSAKAVETPPGEWVVGQANLFFDRKLAEKRFPTRYELDRVSTAHPVALRAGGHLTILNSKALAVCMIDRNYSPPPYSITGLPSVERDESGEPTGIVKEMDNLLPFSAMDREQLAAALQTGIPKLFTQFGVTTIGEISETVDGQQIMNDMAARGDLPVSVRTYLWAPGTLALEAACNWKKSISVTAPDDLFRIQGVKLFADGGFSAKSAAVKFPYLVCGCRGGHTFRGEVALDKGFAQRAIELTQNAGLQLAVHANGDRAQEWVCDTLLEMGGAPTGRIRTRIEHAGNLMPSEVTADKWAAAGIIPVPQPVFLYTFGEYFPDYLGEHGAIGRFSFSTLMKQGWRLSGSSDVWVGSERGATNPLFSVWCCLKRETYSGATLDADEAITLDQALRLHTLDAASVLGEDDVRGSIAPGKFADLIVLDRDPHAVAVDELPKLKVDLVFKNGKQIWDRTKTAGN
ncbi:amidohydrolase [Hyphomicrobium sp.]|uniref:amidohydrolase n=1 Tax=Hyphomicrobium sp. TaxID=82 RepID=UPI001DEA2EE2|nr:amidohydrolase [Hyphomicrobium sp.]MBY0558687.1 amidohydrolase [Hyphomicrobium sp.]